MSDLEFRPYNENDFNEQRELFVSAFPETLETSLSHVEHYNWKFKTISSSPASYQYVAANNEGLVGYYAALPFSYIVQGKRRICGMVCDVMTHPKMQGKGIFTKLGRYSTNHLAESGLDFVSGYPIRPNVIAGHLKVGWTVAMKEPTYIRPISVKSLLNGRLTFLFVKLLDGLLWIYNSFFNLLVKPKAFSLNILSREEFLKSIEYDSFFAEWTKTQVNYLEKSRQFLSWRTSAPQTDYQFIVLKKNEKWIGLAITRMTTLKKVPTLAILDLMLLTDSMIEAAQLHQQIYKVAIRNKAELIACMMGRHWAARYKMLWNGFLKTPYVFSVILKPLKKEMTELLFANENDWHLMWIDSDDL